ncbi:hypothetical protein D3C86_799200 [compost metagenome]
MLQGIADQVLQHLIESAWVPVAAGVTLYIQGRIAFRLTGAGPGNRFTRRFGQVHGRRLDRQALAQAAAHQFQQVPDHHRQVPGTALDIDRALERITFEHGFAQQ